MLEYLTSRPVKKVISASYGSHQNSWYFSFEMIDGTSTRILGKDTPLPLRQWIDQISKNHRSSLALRVQLGDKDSFIAWAKTSWVSHGLPVALEVDLLQLSGNHREFPAHTQGSFRTRLHHVVWHADGSYYMDAREGYSWHFTSSIARSEWAKLWSRKTAAPNVRELSELAVRITPLVIESC